MDSKLKLLFVTNGIHQKSGTYTVLKNICPKLMQNHEVTILTNQGEIDVECTKLIQLNAKSLPFPQYFYQPKPQSFHTCFEHEHYHHPNHV